LIHSFIIKDERLDDIRSSVFGPDHGLEGQVLGRVMKPQKPIMKAQNKMQ